MDRCGKGHYDGCSTARRGSAVLAAAIVLAAGCTPEGRGFKLPDGDAERGKATFVELACNDCHTIGDVERVADSSSELEIRLGGPVSRVKTYGELVTSVINPSHRIARQYPPQDVSTEGTSRMRAYNSVMTVQQLVDLVTFLQDEYDIRPPPSYM